MVALLALSVMFFVYGLVDADPTDRLPLSWVAAALLPVAAA